MGVLWKGRELGHQESGDSKYTEELLHRENRWREGKQALKETNRQCKHSRCQYTTLKIRTAGPELCAHIFLS